MARRRYLTTDISHDGKVNTIATKCGDFAALLYTWMIPHADDRACLKGTPEEILYQVMPGRRDKTVDDVIAALDAMQFINLIQWDREQNIIGFPPQSFYKYQTYIKPEIRRKDDIISNQRKTAQNSEEQRIPADNAASLSVSFSLSPSLKENKLMSVETTDDSLLAGQNDDNQDQAGKAKTNGKSAATEIMDWYNQSFAELWKRPLLLTNGREKKIKARLKRFSAEELCQAIRNIRGSPFHCGENDKGQVYATPDFIFRADEMVDKWLNYKPKEVPQNGAGPKPSPDQRDATGQNLDWDKFYSESGEAGAGTSNL